VRDIPAQLLTHINYAFAELTPSGRLVQSDPWADTQHSTPGVGQAPAARGNLGQLQALKRLHPRLQILLSVGGWNGSGSFSRVAASPAARARFARTACELLHRYSLDGLDLDWEYPQGGGLETNTESPADRSNLTRLVRQLRRALDTQGAAQHRHLLLTLATPADPSLCAHFDLPRLSPLVDWFNLMTYDFHLGSEPETNHHSPLYARVRPLPHAPALPDASPPQPTPAERGHQSGVNQAGERLEPSSQTAAADPGADLSVESVVYAYRAAGVPRHQLVVGVGAYGRVWHGVPPDNGGLHQRKHPQVAPAAQPPTGTQPQLGAEVDYAQVVSQLLGGEAEAVLSTSAPSQRTQTGWTLYHDARAEAAWLYHPSLGGGTFISCDTPQTVQAKAELVRNAGLGGMMLWHLGSDAHPPQGSCSLLASMAAILWPRTGRIPRPEPHQGDTPAALSPLEPSPPRPQGGAGGRRGSRSLAPEAHAKTPQMAACR
jgi:chitinase